jgi:hypothetical protein
MLLKITLLIFKLSSYLSIGGGSSAPPDAVFIILQIIKNKANHHPTRHHAENCINSYCRHAAIYTVFCSDITLFFIVKNHFHVNIIVQSVYTCCVKNITLFKFFIRFIEPTLNLINAIINLKLNCMEMYK